MAGGIVFAGIAPHPPLLIPEIGGERIGAVAESQRALREFSKRLADTKPDSIVLVSPHSPMESNVFRARSAGTLRGDFRDFGAPSVALSFSNDIPLLEEIRRTAAEEGINVETLRRDYPLDHGALVPLFYIREAGYSGPVVVFGFTLLANDLHLAFGRSIKAAAAASGKRIAVVASGDLSHRLIVAGPYEFEPTAHLFDEQIVRGISAGNADAVLGIDNDLRECAGECGYRSIVIAIGSVDEKLNDYQVLSYEGPFGVGYMVAVLTDSNRAHINV